MGSHECTFDLTVPGSSEDQAHVSLSLSPYTLVLMTAFGTSHSSTTTRTNALIKIEVDYKGQKFTGFGEVGLPPKKISAGYLADFQDVKHYVQSYCHNVVARVKAELFFGGGQAYDPFVSFPFVSTSEYFAALRNLQNQEGVGAVVAGLLRALDEEEDNVSAYSRFPRSGIEAAILDLYCQALNIPLYSLIGIKTAETRTQGALLGSSFYTVALNDDIDVMAKQAQDGLKHTPHLKIKLDSDLTKGKTILERIIAVIKEEIPHFEHWKLSIDANGAWSAEDTIKFLEIARAYAPHIYMLEQPFSTTLFHEEENKDEKNLEIWKSIKQAYGDAGILIFADESVSTAHDIPALADYVHGVNIKLEKTGGLRAALEAILLATELNLKVWIGMMVGSRLLSGTAVHLMPLACFGDLDAGLFITEESQLHRAGFEWGQRDNFGHLFFPPSLSGVGVVHK